MIQLEGLNLLLTYRCTGRCAHCCYRAGPHRRETMAVAEVESYLSAAANQPLEWILLFGGEPFIVPDLLRSSVALASRLARVLVFTNGYWATDPDTARHRLADLQAAGLDHILFSVDAFHQAHAPLDRVATGIQAARELGYGTIEIDNRCLGDPEAENTYNRRTRELMARLAESHDLSDVRTYRGASQMVGRALDQLASFLPTQSTPPARCPLPDYLGGDLRAPTAVEIHPGGWVNLCAGLSLGNAQERSLDEILASYDPDAHPIIGPLAQEGPAGLLRLAKEYGHSLPGGYVDGCHLCYQARTLLCSRYPDHLAPAYAYTEGMSLPVLRLEEDIIYGPVHSRRLGRSLGLNLLPTDRKVCSFDCVYCHYGYTDLPTMIPEEAGFPTVAQVLDAVEEALPKHPEAESLTFSGNGEPTLHPRFQEIAAGVRRLRDQLRPNLKLTILSNGTTAHLPRIQETLALFDVPIIKLDAGDPATFAAINRPAEGVRLERIVEGLKAITNLVTQTVFLDGEVSNARGKSFEAWLATLSEVRPAQAQIYSTDRPVPEAGVRKVTREALQRVAGATERCTGIQVTPFWM
jgi:wyosine [tRNA(Phe)-imidazoG37] synthetase (radical SAM superfamily)